MPHFWNTWIAWYMAFGMRCLVMNAVYQVGQSSAEMTGASNCSQLEAGDLKVGQYVASIWGNLPPGPHSGQADLHQTAVTMTERSPCMRDMQGRFFVSSFGNRSTSHPLGSAVALGGVLPVACLPVSGLSHTAATGSGVDHLQGRYTQCNLYRSSLHLHP